MSQLQVTGEAKIRDIQGPVVANSGVVTALDGDASQYVRGDGTLADFPTSTGGGSSVSYYLNSSVSQGTIGGVAYRQLGKTPIAGAGTDIAISANGYIASYLTDANDPALLEVPAGNFNCEFYFSVNSNAHNPFVYAEVYKYDGTTFTLIGSSQSVPEYLTNGTTLSPYYFAIPVAQTVLAITDRIAIRIYVNVDGRTVTLHTENNHLCQVVTTFSKGLTSLNNLTRQVQFLATGTSGTDFGISSSVATHTFNLPIASATNTGKLSSTDWSTFNGKVPYTGATNSVDLGIYNLSASLIDPKQIILKKDTILGGSISIETGSGFSWFGSNDTILLASGASNTLSLRSIVSSVLRTAILDFSTISAATSRTFTLPDDSGTLALTSNLSSYVPYTGATQSVDLGLNNLLAYRLYSKVNSSASGQIFLGQGTVFNNDTGYSTIGADTSGKFYFIPFIAGDGRTGIFDFNTITSNVQRTFTFPDLSGTLALLEGSQTFTGAKTFSVATKLDGSLLLKDGATISTTSGYGALTFVKSSSISSLYLTSDTGFTSALNFVNTNSYNYTFPAASGTIALTSNLSSYVPYSGATASVNLGMYYLTAQFITGTGGFETGLGTGLYLRSNSTATYLSTGYVSLVSNNGNNFNIAYGSSTKEAILVGSGLTSSRSFTFPDASGTIALTSNLSAYLPLTGGTLTGALIGTTATFSGTVSSIVTSGGTSFRVVNSVNSRAWSLVPSTNGAESDLWLYYGGTGTGTKVSFVNNGNVLIGSTTDSGELLQVNGTSKFTGALSGTSATFSGDLSIVTSTSAILNIQGNSGNSKNIFFKSTGAADNSIRLYQDGGTNNFIIATGDGTVAPTNRLTLASTGAATFSSSVAIGGAGMGLTGINMPNQNYLAWYASGGSGGQNVAIRGNGDKLELSSGGGLTMTMDASQRVGIGTSSPSAALNVVTTAAVTAIFTRDLATDATLRILGDSDGSIIDTQGIHNLRFFTNDTERMRITSGGALLVGTTSVNWVGSGFTLSADSGTNKWLCGPYTGAGNQFYITASAGSGVYLASTSASSWSALSDERFKENLIPIENAISKLSKLRPFIGNYIEDDKKTKHPFLIAQDVLQVIPEAVDVSNPEKYGLSYTDLIPVLVKAIQEQTQIIKNLEARIVSLESK